MAANASYFLWTTLNVLDLRMQLDSVYIFAIAFCVNFCVCYFANTG